MKLLEASLHDRKRNEYMKFWRVRGAIRMRLLNDYAEGMVIQRE